MGARVLTAARRMNGVFVYIVFMFLVLGGCGWMMID